MQNITLDLACLCRQTGGRFRVNRKFSIFKKLGVGRKRTAPKACLTSGRPVVSKLNHIKHFSTPPKPTMYKSKALTIEWAIEHRDKLMINWQKVRSH
jgi:hypothetical protein